MSFLWLLPDPENVTVQSSVQGLDCFVPSGKLNKHSEGPAVILTESLRMFRLQCQEKESETQR